MKETTTLKAVGIIILILLALPFLVPGHSAPPNPAPMALPEGDYYITKTAGGADSLEDLIRFDRCLNIHDESCGEAMLRDGRAFELKPGTAVRGSESQNGVFSGTIESGEYVGRTVYVPVAAVK